VGDTAEATCPSSIAYGERGIPGVIPGNSFQEFQVQLLAVSKRWPGSTRIALYVVQAAVEQFLLLRKQVSVTPEEISLPGKPQGIGRNCCALHRECS
jgi:hypothetical protein